MAITSESPRIDVRVEDDLHEALRRLAKQHDRRLPDEVRRALRQYVERENGKA